MGESQTTGSRPPLGRRTNMSNYFSTFWVKNTYMPTPPDYSGVYRSPNLLDKIKLWAFLCFNLEFIPFSPKIWIFFIHSLVSGAFLHVFHHWQRLFRHYNHFDGLYLVFKGCSVEQGWKFFSFTKSACWLELVADLVQITKHVKFPLNPV